MNILERQVVLKRVVAFVLRLYGKPSMLDEIFRRKITTELHWCKTDEEAQKVIEEAYNYGLIVFNYDDSIVPTFDIDKVEIPINFNPNFEV